MRTKQIYALLLLMAMVVLNSCTKADTVINEDEIEIPDTDESSDEDMALVPNTQQLTVENAIKIVFSEGSVVVDNPFENVVITTNKAHVVIQSGETEKELNYVLSGVTSDGSLKIYGSLKFGIILNGVGISNPSGAAINNQCGKKTTVTVVDKTNNRLIDGATYQYVEGEDMKAVFFSEGQLNFYGTGSLELRGKNKHAICTDGYFRMYEGNITIKEAKSDGIHANDYIHVDAGAITVTSSGDGLECEKGYVEINGGTITVSTIGEKAHGLKSLGAITVNKGTINIKVSGKASKGFKGSGDMIVKDGSIDVQTTGAAFYDTEDADIASAAGINCDGSLLIYNGDIRLNSSGAGGKGISVDGSFVMNDGTLTVNTTGGQFKYGNDDTAAKAVKSEGDLTVNGGNITIKTTGVEAEGLESKASVFVNGGTVEVEAYDDCINAAVHIGFTGGYVYCSSIVNDGIDSNGTMSVSGGVIVSAGAQTPEEGFDCDNNQFKITGGIMVGIGGATSTPTSNVCTQRALVFSPATASVQMVRIETASGVEVLTFKMPRTYSQRMTMLFSAPTLMANTSYSIYTAGTISGGTSFHGLYTGAVYTKSGTASTFTTNSMVTTVGTSGGPGQ